MGRGPCAYEYLEGSDLFSQPSMYVCIWRTLNFTLNCFESPPSRVWYMGYGGRKWYRGVVYVHHKHTFEAENCNRSGGWTFPFSVFPMVDNFKPVCVWEGLAFSPVCSTVTYGSQDCLWPFCSCCGYKLGHCGHGLWVSFGGVFAVAFWTWGYRKCRY